MEYGWDGHYDRLRRRSSSMAACVALASLTVAVVVFAVLPGSGHVAEDITRISAIPAGPSGACTRADLDSPPITAMPIPEMVAAPVVVRPAPETEQLSPPSGTPRVSAGRAWSKMLSNGFARVTAAGSVRLVLADLYSADPVVAPPHGRPRPLFDHVLVWAIYGVHQPEVPAQPPGAGDPPCYFESTVFYVDATSGRSLAAEVFVPPHSAL
jgi:hypothetical protein